jgi:hypothetical protein
MKCSAFENMINDYLENALDDSSREAVKRHAQECVGCRKKLDWLTTFTAESSALQGSLMPSRDLWPEIARSIRATQQQKSGWKPSSRQLYWGLRIAALAAAGLVLLMAINRLDKPARNRREIAQSTSAKDDGPPGLPSSGESPASPISHAPSGNAQASQTKPGDSQTRSGLMQGACNCEAPADVLRLIDTAWITDENLPSARKRKIVSERLYSLAVKNRDDFFLHKAAIGEMSSLLSPDIAEHYRQKFEKKPDDPVWIYFYADTLLWKNTPEMIRMLERLTSEYPSFPWPNLALAKAYIVRDDKKVQSYIETFLKLCPDSPAACEVLLYVLRDWDFVASAAGRIRATLAKRTDTQSLLNYRDLWHIEGSLVVQKRRSHYWEDIEADLVRLRNMEQGRSPEFRGLIRAGYQLLEDQTALNALLEKDHSYEARSQKAALQMKSWLKDNPVPPAEATEEEKISYWEKRLKMADVWTREVPEESSYWLERLRLLAELKNHPESEFLAAADKVLEIERNDDQIPTWSGSDIWSVASLYAKQGVRLDQVPSLIAEAKNRERQRMGVRDIGGLMPVAPYSMGFQLLQQAEDVWYLLLDAYIRTGRREEARQCLDAIQSGIAESRNQLLAFRSGLNTVDGSYRKPAESSATNMSSTLALREKRYKETLAQFR